MLNRKALLVVIFANLAITSYMVTEFFFMRFLHYHGQNQFLKPADYDVEVLLPADYEKVSNPNTPNVTLSDGSTHNRTAAWYQHSLPNIKTIDNGRYYVLTTVKGTAPFFMRWLGDFILVTMWSITGLVAGIKVLRSNRPAPPNTAA
jgi:hypothetical protein